MPLFASSFDSISPLAPWIAPVGSIIVTGRNVNGCSQNGTLRGVGAYGTSAFAGIASTTPTYNIVPLGLVDTSTAWGGFMQVALLGDGRIRILAGSSPLGVTENKLLNIGLSIHLNEWYYYEIGGTLTQTIVPFDATHSTLTISVTANVYINNVFVGSATGGGSGIVSNSNLPSGTFNEIQVQGAIVDDAYVNATRIGDCFVQSDDSTVTVEPSAPVVTQTVVEVGIANLNDFPVITQTVIEVGIRPGSAPTIACPIDGSTAEVGVPYSSVLQFSGGTPPLRFSLVSSPAWLTIDPLTGVVSGVPPTTGSFSFIAKVTDANGISSVVDAPCPIVVSGPPPPPMCILPPVPVGETTAVAYTEPTELEGS